MACGLLALGSCGAVFHGSPLQSPLPMPSPNSTPRPILVEVYSQPRPPEAAVSEPRDDRLSEELGRSMVDTGHVVLAGLGEPGSIRVRADYSWTHDANFTLVMSVLTLCVLPGHSSTNRTLTGDVTLPDGQRHEFRFSCSDDNWMSVLLLPVGFLQWIPQESGTATSLDGFGEAIVAFMLEREIL